MLVVCNMSRFSLKSMTNYMRDLKLVNKRYVRASALCT